MLATVTLSSACVQRAREPLRPEQHVAVALVAVAVDVERHRVVHEVQLLAVVATSSCCRPSSDPGSTVRKSNTISVDTCAAIASRSAGIGCPCVSHAWRLPAAVGRVEAGVLDDRDPVRRRADRLAVGAEHGLGLDARQVLQALGVEVLEQLLARDGARRGGRHRVQARAGGSAGTRRPPCAGRSACWSASASRRRAIRRRTRRGTTATSRRDST